jgi:hypothetical protein
MRAWVLTLVAVLLLWACAAELPSATPLGRGPLAEPDRDPSDEIASRRPPVARAVDGGADAEPSPATAPGAPPAPSGADEDAGTEAGPGPDAEPPPIITKTHVFAGDYSGSDTTTIRLPGEPDVTAPDPKARIQITRVSDTEVQIVVIYTPTGGPFCTVSAQVKDNVATIAAGQTCPDAGIGVGFSGTVTSGTAKVTGRRLVIDVELDIETTTPGQRQTGTAGYHFEGWRRLD